jgi:predicted transcriptional regulator
MPKALKNIPKMDAEKLAIFYGQTKATKEEKQKPAQSTEVKKSTVEKMSTVDKKTTLDKVEVIREQLRPLLTFAQEAVYIELFKRSQGKVTDWVGYQEIARETKVSTKTVKRSIDEMANKGLIKKVDFSNNREMKGSKYQLFLPGSVKDRL